MGVTVDVYTWPEVVLAPGVDVTLLHWVVDGNGHSLIEPDRWYWMSAVPEYTDVRPDRPVPAATVEIVPSVRSENVVPRPGLPTPTGSRRGVTPAGRAQPFVHAWLWPPAR